MFNGEQENDEYWELTEEKYNEINTKPDVLPYISYNRLYLYLKTIGEAKRLITESSHPEKLLIVLKLSHYEDLLEKIIKNESGELFGYLKRIINGDLEINSIKEGWLK